MWWASITARADCHSVTAKQQQRERAGLLRSVMDLAVCHSQALWWSFVQSRRGKDGMADISLVSEAYGKNYWWWTLFPHLAVWKLSSRAQSSPWGLSGQLVFLGILLGPIPSNNCSNEAGSLQPALSSDHSSLWSRPNITLWGFQNQGLRSRFADLSKVIRFVSGV